MKRTTTTTSNPFKVGDIVSTSWGYSMTIVDFYQVVRVTPCKVELRSIEQEAHYDGFLSGTCNYGRLWTGQPKTFNHCD